MTKCVLGTEDRVDQINAEIDSNCNWPDDNTSGWGGKLDTVDANLKALVLPATTGSHGFTWQEMMEGIDLSSDTIVDIEDVISI